MCYLVVVNDNNNRNKLFIIRISSLTSLFIPKAYYYDLHILGSNLLIY